MRLPQKPSNFYVYAFGKVFLCTPNPSYLCDFENQSLSDVTFQEKLHKASQTQMPSDYLQLALLLSIRKAPLCGAEYDCNVKRLNFVLLTDFEDIENFYDISIQGLKQVFYFGITTAVKKVQNDVIDFIPVASSKPDTSLCERIFGDEIDYTFDPITNFFNVFIVTDTAHLHHMVQYAIGILEDGYSSIDGFWGLLSPSFYIVIVKVNDTCYYRKKTAYLNGQQGQHFLDSLRRSFECIPNLSTLTIQQYLQELYASNETQEQWNVIFTDYFPLWIRNTSVRFYSYTKHLDVYILANYTEDGVDFWKDQMKLHWNDILLDDKNARSRGNHLLMLDIDAYRYENVKLMPTIKQYMTSTPFSYKSPNRWWIWLIIGSIIFAVLLSVICGFLFWKYILYRRLMREYSWAVGSGITFKEAGNFVQKGKELFIDASTITVDFDKTIGKGSSAIVYEGYLEGSSPVAALYERFETRQYINCKAAVKIGNDFSKDEFEQIFREVEAALKIKWHRHVCCLLGWTVYQSMPVLVFELIEGQDLLSWSLSLEADPLPEKTITKILWQITEGMEYISGLGIVHKDLAARNILLTQRLEVKITDFGLASSCDETMIYEAAIQRRLPLRWMAPETMTNRLFSEFSDVWSFGTLAWEVFSRGAVPYGNIDGNDILDFLKAGNRLQIPSDVSEKWKKILESCWFERRESRPNFQQITKDIGIMLESQTINYGYLITEIDNNEEEVP